MTTVPRSRSEAPTAIAPVGRRLGAGLRVIAALVGIGFLVQGAVWLVAPQRAATGLGMPLLDGLGRSTQIGDSAALFLTLGATMLVGLRSGGRHWLYVPAGMLACAAASRTLAWALQGAAFAAAFIAVEVGVALLLVAIAQQAGRPSSAGPVGER